MAINWARGGLFAGGILVGAVLAGALFTQGGEERRDAAAAAPPAGTLQPTAVASQGRRIDCSFAPIVPPASKDDGLLPLDKDLQGNSPGAVATLILSGKEAAAAGKPRDAETAFLMACRSAEAVKNDPIPLADAQYQLGRHYAQVAAPPDAPKRAELLKRAEALYASSLQVYLKHRGPAHEKTRFAQEGLDALQRLTGAEAASMVAAPNAEERRMADATKVVGNAPPPVATTPAAPAPVAKAAPAAAPAAAEPPAAPAEVAKAPEPKPARRTSPSFDCSRANSTTEKLICADEDLARQDRELGRLHARAKQAAADPRAFQRESDAEWQAREQTCTDRECLQRWYAKRRAELGAAAERGERESAQRAARTERAPAPRVAAPAPAPAPHVVVPAPRVEVPAPAARVEPPPPPAPRAEAPAPLPREADLPPATESMGGPAPTASGSTDIPTE